MHCQRGLGLGEISPLPAIRSRLSLLPNVALVTLPELTRYLVAIAHAAGLATVSGNVYSLVQV